MPPAVPNGLAEILATFADPSAYLKSDGTLKITWERQQIVRAALPYPIPYAYAANVAITRVACHRLLESVVVRAFADLRDAGIAPGYLSYGGCFQVRSKRKNASEWSTHTWGIAIDLRPATNAMGTPGDMDPRVVAVFRALGFVWGGGWHSPDPMHFQYATGY